MPSQIDSSPRCPFRSIWNPWRPTARFVGCFPWSPKRPRSASSVRDGPTLLGVALTFSVSRFDVAARPGFAAPPSPLRPCDLGPGVFRRTATGRCDPSGAAPLLALHPPSRTSSSVPDSARYTMHDHHVSDSAFLPLGSSPLRRSKLGESMSRRSLHAVGCPLAPRRVHLAAGFHTRVVPPPPFSTAVAA
jgi:hypothetical protein